MGKAVYKIEIINVSPFKDDITRLTKEIEELRREKDQKRETAEKAVNLVDLILQDLEHINEDPDIDPDRNKLKAVKYCEFAYDILVKDKDNNIKLLQECLKYWIDVLARLNRFDEAIDISKQYVVLLNNEKDPMILHEAYHEIAGLYFCRGHDEDYAKYNDFEDARRFYDLERRVLDALPADTEHLQDLKRSSDLNMGIIEAKEIGGLERAIGRLKKALVAADSLRRREEKQTTLWEIGNAYRNHGDLRGLLKAQTTELKLIRQYKWKDKEILCLFEITRTHLEMAQYDESRSTLAEISDLVDAEEDLTLELDALENVVVRMESFRVAISKLPNTATLGLVHRRAMLFYELSQTELEQRMLHTALDSAKKGIEEIEKDSIFVQQLAGLLISLKQLQADILWKIRQSDIEELQSLNEEILVKIRLYIENKQQRLENLEKVYERMANLYYYFEQEDSYDKWDKLYNDCLKALEPYEKEDENMNWDHNEEEELNNAIASMDISAAEIKEGEDGSTQKKMDPILTVRVALNINKEEKMLSIQVFNDTKCISWLMQQVAQKAWEEYGYEPKVYELKTEASGSLSPQVLVVVAIQGNFELVYACYDGFREKTPLETYQNSCARNKVPIRRGVEQALQNNDQADALVLADTCLVSCDIPIICDLLSRIKPVTKVDLSGNVLYDHDIIELFKHIKDLHYVDLSSNRITYKTIARLAYPNLGWGSFSYNPLGSEVLTYLPELLRKCPRLDSLDLQSCDIDNYTLQDILSHEYQQYSGHRLSSLNLSNNALINDSSFEQWQPLLQKLLTNNVEF